MADISRIVDSYELYGSKKRVACELKISQNTVRKYLDKVEAVQDGSAEEILLKDRKISQPSRVLTEIIRDKIHQYLESNLERPRKQRLTAKRICELLNISQGV
jgi:predicted transcriptional regulator